MLPAIVAAAGAIVLVGCQGEAGENKPPSSVESTQATAGSSPSDPIPSPSEAGGSPAPTPASSNGPAANIPVPEKPALADENTREGLEAFTRYWFELLNHGYTTNNWNAFDTETDPGCRTCGSIKANVLELYAQGRWVQGADISVVSFSTKFEESLTGSITSFVENQQNEIVYFESDGTVLKVTPKQPSPVLDVVIATWEQGSWLMLDYGQPEGTS
jgi:hypothetical protein